MTNNNIPEAPGKSYYRQAKVKIDASAYLEDIQGKLKTLKRSTGKHSLVNELRFL